MSKEEKYELSELTCNLIDQIIIKVLAAVDDPTIWRIDLRSDEEHLSIRLEGEACGKN